MNEDIYIKPKEIAPGVFSTGGFATQPKVNATSIGNVPPINIQPVPPITPPSITGAEASNEQFNTDYQRMLDLQAQPKEQNNALNTALQQLTTAEQNLQGAGATQLATEQQLGIPTISKERASNQGLIKSAAAEYNALKSEFDQASANVEAGAGRLGLTTGAVMGQQGAIERAKLARLNSKAAEIGLLQAKDLSLAGDLEAAQRTADRAVDLMFRDRELEYQTKLSQYNRIKDQLSGEEAKRGKALEYALNKEAKKIEEEKAKMKEIQSISLEAAKNGAPQSVLSKLATAKTFEEAIRIGGQYMTDPLDRSIKAAQLRKLQLENNANNPEKQNAIVNSVVNEKDPTKLISNFFKSNPKLKTNQDINNAAAVVSAINEVAGGTQKRVKGYGFLGGGFAPEAFVSQEAITNRAKIAAVEGKLQQWLSGAALSKAQEKLVRKMVPEKNDTDATVRTKLNQLTNYMLGDIKGRTTAQGVQFEYIPVDLFSAESAQPSIQTSAVQAVSAGYEPKEVVEFIIQNYPEQASLIEEARQNGYSEEEIIQYISTQ